MTQRKAHNFIAVLMAVFLVMTAAAAADAKTIRDPSPDPGTRHYQPLDSESGYYGKYCMLIKDIKYTVMKRDSDVSKGTLEKGILRKLNKNNVEFLVYGTHEKPADTLKISGIGKAGLKKASLAKLSGGYRMIPLDLQISSSGTSEKTTVKSGAYLILVYAKNEKNGAGSGSAGGKTAAGEASGGGRSPGAAVSGSSESPDGSGVSDNSTSKQGKSKNSRKPGKGGKNPVAKITKKKKKNDGDPQNNVPGQENGNSTAGNGQNPGPDKAAIALTAADGAAAALLAAMIIPDIMIILWYSRKQRSNRENKEKEDEF